MVGRELFKPEASFIDANRITLDISYIINPVEGVPFISRDELDEFAPEVLEKHRMLKNGQGDCHDNGIPMLGWLSMPDQITVEQLDDIASVAAEIAGKIDAYVSLGIGGSYLGIEATFKALSHNFFNQIPREERGGAPEIYFLGQNTDPDFYHDTLALLRGKKIGVNVISKSGTTTETAIAFRLLRNMLEKNLGGNTAEFIIATTDRTRGALRQLANSKGYKTFVVPDNIGGRFSILSDVGLVGLAVAGINIYEFTAGFRRMKALTETDDFWTNPAMIHAAVRHLAYKKGKKIEVVATNSTALYQVLRWMEQLFPESEGHDGYGLWVSPSLYSEKLHANGQMVQDGERNIIETFIKLRQPNHNIEIPSDDENLDGLNYLPDDKRDLNFINQLVIDGPAYAHFKGSVPNMMFEIPRRNAFNLGQFYYLMERSVALTGYLAGHNPFIQPGVEDYKKAIFALAGKPGSETYGREIMAEIKRSQKTIIG